ncbi:SDR family NAD(P)-dependent oxidoreductase [Actinomadura geliboluensis]|uniref:SDR family NAD(P)-dependent oxidoreductase n=1 Tax=Actinomadura geliboluensis TaxID=882440 RepID=UPI00371C2D34
MTAARPAAPAIAIVGAGCRYPDAAGPARMWEMVVAGRRAFRPLPPERLNLADYAGDGPDSTYVRHAAVLEDWSFDRARHRVPGAAYRAADPTHWLALEVAAETLASAGFPDASGLDGDRAGVILGDTLTGEFSRAALLRMRWPYVRRTVQDALAATPELPADAVGELLARLEHGFKEPFPEPTDESLVGGLANAIAGRVCNHFDLRGGGYTVDGACSSSLLAVTAACTALCDGDLDFALAGGVDLSLDPFELVGFARLGALATDRMRVYDADPTGFLPGEGCGMVALMRADDAAAAGRTPLALIRGWGISSDGSGGLTRPERDGQLLAMRRAYARAGIDPATVTLFEGHGTGTAVGDRAELAALTELLAGRTGPPAVLGSVKANIGHTKAAAGAAGLIKAALALHHRVLPPTVGCEQQHELLRAPGAPLRVLAEAAPWPDAPVRAAVSAMGFGGINTHLVLEAADSVGGAPRELTVRERRLARRAPDAEVFAFAADTPADLASTLRRVAARAARMSSAEHLDLAAALAENSAHAGAPVRAAIVARDPAQLADRARAAARHADAAGRPGTPVAPGVYLGTGPAARVGLLFPGQGAPVHPDAGALALLMPDLATTAHVRPTASGGSDTALVQPAVLRASLTGLALLDRLGVVAAAAAGHSLGEITALCWAGALTPERARELVAARGRIMAGTGTSGTGMVTVAAPPDAVRDLIAGTGLAIAADNGAAQVVGGSRADLAELLRRAGAAGVTAQRLEVSHAFHTAAVAAAAGPLADVLRGISVGPPRRRVHSTVTGTVLTGRDDLRALLVRQITEPVRFREALDGLAADCDLIVECGPGHMLTALAQTAPGGVPALPLDVGAASAAPAAAVIAALFAAGAAGGLKPLFADRFHRPFALDREPVFLSSPCETAPDLPAPPAKPAAVPEPVAEPAEAVASDPLTVVRDLVSAALELPADAIGDDDGLLQDLHLNSLRVTQLASLAAERCGRAVTAAPPPLAGMTVTELAAAIEALPKAADPDAPGGPPTGVAEWHRVLAAGTRPAVLPGTRWDGGWHVRGTGPLRALVEPLLVHGSGPSVQTVFFLPADPGDEVIGDLLSAAAEAVRAAEPLTIVDHGDTAAGLLGALAAEHPDRDLRRIAAPESSPRAVLAAAVTASWTGAAELAVTPDGRIGEPVHHPVRLDDAGPPLSPGDVLLVTGGGRGIGLETAAYLSGRWNVRLALIGRARPGDDPELAANLARLEAAGATVRYEPADVTDPAALRAAVGRLTEALGPVRGVVHASGVNRPARFTDLGPADFAAHAAPKHHGLRALLAALDPAGLRLLLTFGSVIGRFGLAGEAHYALANGRLREYARLLAEELPGCRVRNIDWTAWSGTGMGERLDVLAALERTGVVPLPTASGVLLAARIAESERAPATVLATGRLPQLDTPSGAPWRVRTHTPGIELIAETDLDLSNRPWLDDHRIDGLAVLPAVAALELMARAAAVLTGEEHTAVADANFDRPIVVPDEGSRTVRICALTLEDGGVRVALRTDETGFAADHFTATVVPAGIPPKVEPVATEPEPHDGRALYGSLFFHGPRFQRLVRYTRLAATGCTAELSASPPQDDLLGDTIRNDASIHVLQACVPHRRLLPIGCDRFAVHGPGEGTLTLDAVERAHHGPDYTYDVVLRDETGRPVLSWTGLRLRDVGPLRFADGLPPVLVEPYLRRNLAALMPAAEDITIVRDDGAGPHVPWTDQAVHLAKLTDEPDDLVLRRLRAVRACLPGDVTVQEVYEDGWVTLRAGGRPVVSALLTIAGHRTPLAIAAAPRTER